MNETVEKIVIYALGGIAGIAAGLILINGNAPFRSFVEGHCLTIINILLGFLFASIFLQIRKEKLFDQTKKIRDETVALITHEMRTGLTATGWAIEVILDNYKDKLEEEHRKMLEDVTKSINTTVMHSVNLLDTSLLDIGKLVIALKWIKLGEIENTFVEILQKYKLGAKQKGIDLEWNIHLDKDRWVEVDSLRIKIMIENLLENALQYTVGAVRKITVTIENDAYDMKITVSDTGIGIPNAEKSKIFSEFFRASNARKVLSTGSGIGLHMCYQYTLAHHGKISFTSEENQGTTFHISLPLKTSANIDEFVTKI